jgi:DNA mismatch repair ATPase MutS
MIFPFVTLALIIFFSVSEKYPASLGFVGVIFQMVMARYKKRQFRQVMGLASNYKDMIKAYEELTLQVENESFESELLKKTQQKLFSQKKIKASKQIGKLDAIVDWMGLRYSGIYGVVDSLFFWDFHCVRALEKWKKNSGKTLRNWLEAIAEFEVLSSLALLSYDNPHWSFPEISNERYEFEAKGLGHPLLPVDEMVPNDLSFENEGSILMITGSNMSGKSTMLRTVALNLVLAYLGAPVCAQSLKCSIMNIYTSMRTSDNLEKNISSFYAELLRIKMILEAAKQGERMLFFLDELFKGTNSRDRKIGAETVIKTLTKAKVSGFVSTHDLELADLEADKSINLTNYYFKEHYVDQKIKFDYKMRAGVSNTSDAIYLMKMIGLDV